MASRALAVLEAIRTIAGGFLAICATYLSTALLFFRFETAAEYRLALDYDVVVGAMFAGAFLLCLGPTRLRPRLVLKSIATAALIWLAVSGGLIEYHKWQNRVRSGIN